MGARPTHLSYCVINESNPTLNYKSKPAPQISTTPVNHLRRKSGDDTAWDRAAAFLELTRVETMKLNSCVAFKFLQSYRRLLVSADVYCSTPHD